jgi:hypothetical protein
LNMYVVPRKAIRCTDFGAWVLPYNYEVEV